jgi:TolB-like protein/Tfp pilus assembly protein PilF
MNEKTGKKAIFGLALLVLGGALVVIAGLVIGLNVGGVRDRLLGGGVPRIESIAVLPFENLSHDPAQQYFASGMTSTFVGDLQQIGGVRVIAPSSVAKYKKAPKPLPEIARELNLDAVIEGSVLRTGNNLQLTVKLTYAPANRRLWDHTYERDLRDVWNLQAEVLRTVAREIKVTLTPREQACFSRSRPMNPQAYDALLQGRGAGNPTKTEEYFRQAIQLDPTNAMPYVQLASLYDMLTMDRALAPGDTYLKAKEAAQKAVSLDPTLSIAHRILATAALEYDWDFVEAEKEFKRGVEFCPNGLWAHHLYAHFLLSMGRMEEARAETRRIVELDPAGGETIACVSWHDITEHNYEEAEKRASLALSLGAPDQLARLTLGWSYLERGRHAEAIPEFQRAVVGWKNAVFPTAALGHAYAVAGQESAAREVLNRLLARSKTEYVSPYEIAVVYAGLGDKDRAFEWLEKAFEERATLLVYFRMDPRIWSLRSESRFQNLLDRMNFPKARR